jgi:molybdopterin-guanine dinucleotide biosynthesis protein A
VLSAEKGETMMNIVLLSGGSGKRLWPLSNDIRSKQFIKIFKCPDGSYESMVQRVYRQIKQVDKGATVTIATSKTQVSAIHNQLGEEVGISVEPCRRDTFPAIALATAYLANVQGVDPEEPVVVCPVDPYVEDDYFEALKALSEQAAKSEANLVLMGIEPTYPSEKYGYIIPKNSSAVSDVATFKEKPDAETATLVGEIITFLGNPVIALFISLCLGAFLLAKDLDNKTVVGMMNDALRDAGPIVMITAGGGALGAVVKATGAAGMMANGIVAIGIPGILVPLLIGTIMRFPQGSGTTAMITGSAIIAPMLATLGINPYLAGLAVCLTSMCPSFLNDSYFHVVTSFSGMDIKTSLKTWTIGSILVPVFGSVIICILSLFIH